MRVFALHGLAGSGKSTARRIIVGQCGLNGRGVVTLKFAGAVKELVRVIIHHAYDGIYSQEDVAEICELALEGGYKEVPFPCFGGLSPRILMHVIGNDFRLRTNPTLWRDYTLAKLKVFAKSGHDICIDDLRFMEEAVGLKEVCEALPQCSELKLVKIKRDNPHKYVDGKPPNGSDIFASLEELSDKLTEHIKGLLQEEPGLAESLGMQNMDVKTVFEECLKDALEALNGESCETKTHSSEAGLDDSIFDVVIENNGSEADFHLAVLSNIG